MATAGNNTIRAELEGKMEKFGRAYGQGQNSRPMAALEAVSAAQNNAITPDDAAELWGYFQRGNSKAKGVEYKEEGSIKVQISKFRQFIVVGSIPGLDAVGVMNRTVDIIKEMVAAEDAKLGGSAYDKLTAVARAQIKNEAVALTDDEIRGILMPDAKEKDEEATLTAIKNAMTKAYFGNKEGTVPTFPSPELERALQEIESRLAEITGLRTRKEEDVQLAALLMKRGLTIADMAPGNIVAAE